MAIENLDPAKAHQAMQNESDFVFVDVRTVEEYEQGHPKSAINIPWAVIDPRSGQMAQNPDFLATMQKNVKPGTKVFASCQSGIRSMNACRDLEGAGYTALVNVEGGFGGKRDPTGAISMDGWKDSGLPVESSKSTYGTLKA
ncbi:MAG: rhodanese-like domain-containing protein [Planctomycetota bacterium]|jgi:rhodanese-related sulfurtransferase